MLLASDPVGASGVPKVIAVDAAAVIDLVSAQKEAERAKKKADESVIARSKPWSQGDFKWRCYVV